jgi:hypothetical protein
LNALTHELFTIEHLTSMTAETVCELLPQLAGAHQGIPISVILDNARYQRCAFAAVRPSVTAASSSGDAALDQGARLPVGNADIRNYGLRHLA